MVKQPIQKIAVLRALQLGDMLCAVPAFRALRYAFPEAEITLLGLPWAETFVKRFHKYVDRFIHFPGYEGLPEQASNPVVFDNFLQQIQNESFDLMIQMQGNGTIVNDIVCNMGAKNVAGFYPNWLLAGPNPLFLKYPENVHEIHRHLALMEHLGIPSYGSHLEFPITPTDKVELESLLLPLGNKKYVCIHPGSRESWRQWPPEYFAAIADVCVEKGFTVVVTGTDSEEAITNELVKCAWHPVINLTGQTTLGALGVLVKNAYLLISNCTGVSHIAAATQTKSIVISMDGEPHRWGPLNKQLHYTIDCSHSICFDKVIDATNAFLRTDDLLAV